MNGGDLQLPPGFRFHPTDEELVMHYLCRKCTGLSLAVPIIAEIDLYKYDPWQLPGLASYGEKEWYFFSPRDRKYPNGSRPNRAAGSGYWKATGADKPVGTPKPVAIKKALVFYSGKAPKGDKTNWIMHEYRLANVDRSARKKNNLRLDDWVLCRIYKKKGAEKPNGNEQRAAYDSRMIQQVPEFEQKPEVIQHVTPTFSHVQQNNGYGKNDWFNFDASESMPRLHADSSCSEHVLSSDFTCDREVQSQLKWGELERALAVPFNNVNATSSFPTLDNGPLTDPLQDIFMYLQKPF